MGNDTIDKLKNAGYITVTDDSQGIADKAGISGGGGGEPDNVLELDILRLYYATRINLEEFKIEIPDMPEGIIDGQKFATFMGLNDQQLSDLVEGKYNKIKFINCPKTNIGYIAGDSYNSWDEFKEAWNPAADQVEYFDNDSLPIYSIDHGKILTYGSQGLEIGSVLYFDPAQYSNVMPCMAPTVSFCNISELENNLFGEVSEWPEDPWYPFSPMY